MLELMGREIESRRKVSFQLQNIFPNTAWFSFLLYICATTLGVSAGKTIQIL
jgi:ABC-type dipeptide/oligopeptide/nickel transport system permease component